MACPLSIVHEFACFLHHFRGQYLIVLICLAVPDLDVVADAHYVDYGWDALPIGQYKYGISTDGGNTIDWSECLEKDVMVVDENNAMEIKVYPNPTNNVLFVETRLIASLPAEYIITNVTGQTLLSGHITNEIQQIDVTRLAEGMYFVRIQSDNAIHTCKFNVIR